MTLLHTDLKVMAVKDYLLFFCLFFFLVIPIKGPHLILLSNYQTPNKTYELLVSLRRILLSVIS